MTSKKWYFYPLIILNLIALFAGAAGSVYLLMFEESAPYLQIGATCVLVATLLAGLYAFEDFKKAGAANYVMFTRFYILAEFASILFTASLLGTENASGVQSMTGILMHVVVFGVVIMLSFGKDLGRVISFLSTGIVLALNLFMLITTLTARVGSGAYPTIFTWYSVAETALAVTLWTAVFAKYADKTTRGK